MTARCEPPEALRQVDGWHWLWHDRGGGHVAFWVAEAQNWGTGRSVKARGADGWRWDAQCLSPAELAALRAENERLKTALTALVADIDDLTGESNGVEGLHRNGDIAPWSELLPGGRYEWLGSLTEARAALNPAPSQDA